MEEGPEHVPGCTATMPPDKAILVRSHLITLADKRLYDNTLSTAVAPHARPIWLGFLKLTAPSQ